MSMVFAEDESAAGGLPVRALIGAVVAAAAALVAAQALNAATAEGCERAAEAQLQRLLTRAELLHLAGAAGPDGPLEELSVTLPGCVAEAAFGARPGTGWSRSTAADFYYRTADGRYVTGTTRARFGPSLDGGTALLRPGSHRLTLELSKLENVTYVAIR